MFIVSVVLFLSLFYKILLLLLLYYSYYQFYYYFTIIISFIIISIFLLSLFYYIYIYIYYLFNSIFNYRLKQDWNELFFWKIRGLFFFEYHIFGAVFEDLKIWECQNRSQHEILPQGQFLGGPGSSGAVWLIFGKFYPKGSFETYLTYILLS